MSYARFGPNSDVYVYASGDNVFTCCGCKLVAPDTGQTWEHGGKAILSHLQEHIAAGHKVPEYCIKALKLELDEEEK